MYLTKAKQDAKNLIDQTEKKLESLPAVVASLKLPEHRVNRFLATCLLDFFLTQVSPRELAEYYNLRAKGKI